MAKKEKMVEPDPAFMEKVRDELADRLVFINAEINELQDKQKLLTAEAEKIRNALSALGK